MNEDLYDHYNNDYDDYDATEYAEYAHSCNTQPICDYENASYWGIRIQD